MSRATLIIWLRGLAAAAISGAATAITAWDGEDWEATARSAAVAAVIGAALYLAKSPVPEK